MTTVCQHHSCSLCCVTHITVPCIDNYIHLYSPESW